MRNFWQVSAAATQILCWSREVAHFFSLPVKQCGVILRDGTFVQLMEADHPGASFGSLPDGCPRKPHDHTVLELKRWLMILEKTPTC